MIALAGRVILRGFVRQELQRDETAEHRVFRFVDYSHATAAQQFHNAVVGKSSSRSSLTSGPMPSS